MCHNMKIGKIINDCIPTRSNIDMGTNVIAMIVDTLSGRSPLYHVEKFYQDMDTELLFGFPISPKSFNDDALGRTLDRISTYGTQKLFTSISLQVVKDYNIDISQGNYDTTSVNVWGEYDSSSAKVNTPHITHGYSKDKRPDLKQFMVSMLCAEGNIPISGKMQDGNASDTKLNNEELQRVSKLLSPLKQESGDFIYVADCKLVTPDNLDLLTNTKFISRLPSNYKEHQRAIDEALNTNQWFTIGELAETPSHSQKRIRSSYQSHDTTVNIEGVSYRASVIRTDQLDKRKTKGIERRKEKQKVLLGREIKKLNKLTYFCAEDAKKALEQHISKNSNKYWRLTGEVYSRKIYAKGRPAKSGERKPAKIEYKLDLHLEADTDYYEIERSRAGCFVLISNIPSSDIEAKKLLKTYKSQYGIEQNFSFLKEPLIVNDTFIKTPSRIDALVMILLLSLLVWNLIQRQLRNSKECKEGKLHDLNKRPTNRPTCYLFIQNLRNIMIMKRGNERCLARNKLRDQPRHYLQALGLDETCYTTPANQPIRQT